MSDARDLGVEDVWSVDGLLPAQSDGRRVRHITGERQRWSSTSSTAVESPWSIELVRGADQTNTGAHVMPRSRSEMLNRAVNFALAALAILIASPVLLLIALAIKLTSRGPVLYTQKRVGLDRRIARTHALFDRRKADSGGELFTIYKFRTMCVDAERECGEVWATQDDPRVTPIGRFLRRTRLDELPQLWNVIRGDMNIVGPRPERPSIFANLRQRVPEYPLRQRTRPGITGLAQINHTYDTSIDDVRTKVRYDLEYLQRQCLAEDIMIMVKTVPVILFRKGGW